MEFPVKFFYLLSFFQFCGSATAAELAIKGDKQFVEDGLGDQ